MPIEPWSNVMVKKEPLILSGKSSILGIFEELEF